MLPEDLPLTTAELKKLFHAAGYATHQKIADALKVEKTLVTKWLSGGQKLTSARAVQIRNLEPAPGSERSWNDYCAGVPATIAAFKASILSLPEVPPALDMDELTWDSCGPSWGQKSLQRSKPALWTGTRLPRRSRRGSCNTKPGGTAGFSWRCEGSRCSFLHASTLPRPNLLPAPFLSYFSGTGETGEKLPPERYVPDHPLPGQKLPPCDSGLREDVIGGGCWGRMDGPPPCGQLYRGGNKCYRPIAADPSKPMTDGDEQHPTPGHRRPSERRLDAGMPRKEP